MVPQTKVFVGSLPPGSKPQDLRRIFERFGVVTECDIMNRCGFVHMSTEEEASVAIKELDNSSFNGAVITVERGRIKERGSSGRAGGAPAGGRMGNGGGPRGPMRNGMGGGGGGNMRGDLGPRGMGGPRGGPDSRGPPRGPGGPMRSNLGGAGGLGGGRSAPYDRRLPLGGSGGGYERGLDRAPLGRDLGYPDERYSEDRRGFALLDDRRGGYGDGGPIGRGQSYPDEGRYAEDRRGFALVDDRRIGGGGRYGDDYGMYPEERGSQAPLYDDMLDRRGGGSRAPPGSGYDRGPQGPPMGNGAGAMFTRRPSPMSSGGGGGSFDRGDRGGGYNQRFQPLGR